MKIEWEADFHRDGSRRKHPIPNTMHGWLAKMRGTLIGNERLRSRVSLLLGLNCTLVHLLL
ncbi:hypothetical protein DFS33DRAFT_1313945, partial [Desarmillaria ectypa]